METEPSSPFTLWKRIKEKIKIQDKSIYTIIISILFLCLWFQALVQCHRSVTVCPDVLCFLAVPPSPRYREMNIWISTGILPRNAMPWIALGIRVAPSLGRHICSFTFSRQGDIRLTSGCVQWDMGRRTACWLSSKPSLRSPRFPAARSARPLLTPCLICLIGATVIVCRAEL